MLVWLPSVVSRAATATRWWNAIRTSIAITHQTCTPKIGNNNLEDKDDEGNHNRSDDKQMCGLRVFLRVSNTARVKVMRQMRQHVCSALLERLNALSSRYNWLLYPSSTSCLRFYNNHRGSDANQSNDNSRNNAGFDNEGDIDKPLSKRRRVSSSAECDDLSSTDHKTQQQRAISSSSSSSHLSLDIFVHVNDSKVFVGIPLSQHSLAKRHDRAHMVCDCYILFCVCVSAMQSFTSW